MLPASTAVWSLRYREGMARAAYGSPFRIPALARAASARAFTTTTVTR
jgi:hypothetical protein